MPKWCCLKRKRVKPNAIEAYREMFEPSIITNYWVVTAPESMFSDPGGTATFGKEDMGIRAVSNEHLIHN